jgi:hypothetical protein
MNCVECGNDVQENAGTAKNPLCKTCYDKLLKQQNPDETSKGEQSTIYPSHKNYSKLISTVIAVIILLFGYFGLGLFVIQPIGAVPNGATVVYWRLGTNMPFISSADGISEKTTGSVSLLGRGLVLGMVAKVLEGRKIVSLPYISALYAISTGGKTYESSNSSSPSSESSSDLSQDKGVGSNAYQNVPKSEPALPGSQWSYDQDDDQMSKGTIYRAYVSSSNTVNFDSPYDGEQHATLTLRSGPRYGKDIIFQIEKGQFLCPSYEACAVLVRFDDEEAVTYSGIGPSDNSTVTIFIRNYSRFVEKMLKAKRVRIAANIYQQGAPVFDFDVSGFDQDRYKVSKATKP